MSGPASRVVVVGQVGRDLVLRVDGLPGPGGSAPVRERRELLGGKGANQAVLLARAGLAAALLGVVGDDDAGAHVLAQARADGIDTALVVVRPGAATALLVDVTDGRGERRLLEHVPPEVEVREADVAAAGPALGAADAVVVQLQTPGPAALAAARAGRPGALVVLDGAPGPGVDPDALLAAADVLRADAEEAALLCGGPVDDAGAASAAAGRLRPRLRGRACRGLPAGGLVALALPGVGNLLAWDGGEVLLPLARVDVVDPTGGGDAFTAGLTAALLAGQGPGQAGLAATDAAAGAVTRPGGRAVPAPPGRGGLSP